MSRQRTAAVLFLLREAKEQIVNLATPPRDLQARLEIIDMHLENVSADLNRGIIPNQSDFEYLEGFARTTLEDIRGFIIFTAVSGSSNHNNATIEEYTSTEYSYNSDDNSFIGDINHHQS